ncbi:hypothetical protein B1F69_13025, partial [Pseudomonas syringae]
MGSAITDVAAVAGPPALHPRGISKRFGGTQALGGVNPRGEAGKIHGLGGGNGGGQTTPNKGFARIYCFAGGRFRVSWPPLAK